MLKNNTLPQMDSLLAIKNALIEKINAVQLQSSQLFSQCQVRVPLNINVLSWLKGQSHYPQFYFALREREEKLATLGEIATFDNITEANKFVQTQQLPLFGGVQFYGKTHFFLPQLLLRQDQQELIVTVFLVQSDLTQSKKSAVDFLKNFEKQTALSPIQQELTVLAQQADQTTWCDWVEQGLNEIRTGNLNKIVLANATDFVSEHAFDMRDFVAKSERYNQGCYHFLWAKNASEMFVGASPERLYSRQERYLQTEALAGTASVTDDPIFTQQQAIWLLNDEKNLYENGLVAEGIQQNLAPYADQFEVSAVQIKPLRLVQHLIRPIRARLKEGVSDADCLRVIHPTAAVAGLPQQKAKDVLKKIENFDRAWYAGTLGFISPAQAEFSVALRSAMVNIESDCNKIRVFAGAGIVEGSVPLLEWQEIERKACALISLLALTE